MAAWVLDLVLDFFSVITVPFFQLKVGFLYLYIPSNPFYSLTIEEFGRLQAYLVIFTLLATVSLTG